MENKVFIPILITLLGLNYHSSHAMEKEVAKEFYPDRLAYTEVFRDLTIKDLGNCALVSKKWCEISSHNDVWGYHKLHFSLYGELKRTMGSVTYNWNELSSTFLYNNEPEDFQARLCEYNSAEETKRTAKGAVDVSSFPLPIQLVIRRLADSKYKRELSCEINKERRKQKPAKQPDCIKAILDASCVQFDY